MESSIKWENDKPRRILPFASFLMCPINLHMSSRWTIMIYLFVARRVMIFERSKESMWCNLLLWDKDCPSVDDSEAPRICRAHCPFSKVPIRIFSPNLKFHEILIKYWHVDVSERNICSMSGNFFFVWCEHIWENTLSQPLMGFLTLLFSLSLCVCVCLSMIIILSFECQSAVRRARFGENIFILFVALPSRIAN